MVRRGTQWRFWFFHQTWPESKLWGIYEHPKSSSRTISKLWYGNLTLNAHSPVKSWTPIMFDGKIIISINCLIWIHPLDLKTSYRGVLQGNFGGNPRNWIPLYKSGFWPRRNSTKKENGRKNACLRPKNAQAADEYESLPFYCDQLLLIFTNDFFNDVMLRKPSGKTPGNSLNISGWQIHPSGQQLAQNKHLGVLWKTLETFCYSVQDWGA